MAILFPNVGELFYGLPCLRRIKEGIWFRNDSDLLNKSINEEEIAVFKIGKSVNIRGCTQKNPELPFNLYNNIAGYIKFYLVCLSMKFFHLIFLSHRKFVSSQL